MSERVDYRSLVERDWLGQWDLMGRDGSYRDAVVEIAEVRRYVPRARRKLADGTDEKLKRLAVSFVGKRKSWLAGPVSQQAIAGLYGPIIQDWIGKKIALYVDPTVKMGRQTTGGIRVRPVIPNGAVTVESLDNPVDEARAAVIASAREET
jgi:hypothetical protein